VPLTAAGSLGIFISMMVVLVVLERAS